MHVEAKTEAVKEPELAGPSSAITAVEHQSKSPGRSAAAPAAISQHDRDRLVRLAYRFLWNRDDAEDAAQKALLIGQAQVGELRDPAKWWSWICRIVVRHCHLAARDKQRWRRHEPSISAALGRSKNAAADVGDEVANVELKDLLRRLLPELPPRQQEVLVLRHLEGMSFDAVAEILDIAPATARVYAQAGLERLRTLIRHRHPDLLAKVD